MQYKVRYTFERIDQDLAPDKRDTRTHLNIVNMEVFLTSRGASLQAAKGTQEFTYPIGYYAPYNNELAKVFVIGHGQIDDDLYIFTTDNRSTPNDSSIDAIYKVIVKQDSIDVELVKNSNWNFSTQYPITCWGIRENGQSEKLYWIDGYNQARFTNVLDKEDVAVDYVLTNPTPAVISAIPYGVAASRDAVVRYGYTQYNIGGSESKLSALTNPINISTEGDSAQINISGLTSTYEAYRVYRIMWETYNSAPTYNLVAEGLVNTQNPSVTVIDGGNLFISDVSTEEFFDIGSDLLIPKASIPKKQRLFFGNYKVEPFRIYNDMRAYSFGNGNTTLDTPSAIPADLNLLYAPTDGGAPVTSTVIEYINGNSITEVLDPFEYCDPFTIPYTGFYIQLDSTSNSAWLELVDFDDVNFTGPKKYLTLIDIGGPIRYVNYGAEYPNGYRVRMRPLTDEEGLGQTIKIWYDAYLWQKFEFTLPHDEVPTTDGWVYSGVTGVLDTSRVRFSFLPPSQTGSQSEWLSNTGATPGVLGSTDFTLTPVSGGTHFEIDRVGRLDINGNDVVAVPNMLIYPYMEADLTGTRQQVLSLDGEIRLIYADGTPPDGNAYTTWIGIPVDHDAVNYDYSTYKYQADGNTLGAEGRHVKFEWDETTGGTVDHKERVFKSGEIYRIGVVCYDTYGRFSDAMWSCDLKVPYANGGNATTGHRNFYRLKATIKDLPAGVHMMKFVYVKRELWDMSVIAQGLIQPVMNYDKGGEQGLYPFPTTKELKGPGAALTWFDVRTGSSPTETDFPVEGTQRSTVAIHDNKINLVYTPETFLFQSDLPVNRVRIVGAQKINTTFDTTRMEFYNLNPIREEQGTWTGVNGIRFDMKAEWGGDDMPECILDDFKDEGTARAIWMYSRMGGTFYSSSQTADVNDKQEEVVASCKYMGIDSVATSGSYVISNVIDEIKFSGAIGAQYPANYQAEHADCYVVEMNSADWAGVSNYSDFLNNNGMVSADRAFPIVDLVQNLSEQYGGKSVEAKSRNYYIDASQGTSSVGVPITLFGDVYNGVYYIPKSTSSRKVTNDNDSSVFDYIKIGLESRVYPKTMNQILRDINGSLSGAIASNLKALEVKNIQDYDPVHSVVPNALITQSRPFNFVDVTEFTNRITVAGIKVANEVIDSWTKVSLGTYLDLESQFGPITSLVRARDNVFSFQSRGIAFISIYPDRQTSTEAGPIQLGKGAVLDNYQYISENSGTENKHCIASHENSIFFIDTVNKTLNSLEEGEVSTLKGFNSVVSQYMNDDVREFLTGGQNFNAGFVWINNRYKQVMFKFAYPDDFPVLAYNYATRQFVNSRTYVGDYYMTFNNYVLSCRIGNLYRHDHGPIGTYHNKTYPAHIEMYVEPLPGTDKVFDAISVLKEGNLNFDKIKVTSPSRTSGDALVNLLFKSKFDIHTAHLPRVENSLDRWRERNVKLLLEYNGTEPLVVDEIFVKFSVKK